MTINIELKPDEELALCERARLSGRDLASYVHEVLQEHIRASASVYPQSEPRNGAALRVEDLIDYEAVISCEQEADGTITLEQVRAATSKIKDSMARVVIEEERAERSRTLDALQLSVALLLHQTAPIDQFVCADQRLCEIALLEGLPTVNPAQPCCREILGLLATSAL